jgi:hypothetical protein
MTFFLRGLEDSVIYPRAMQQRIFRILGGFSIYCLRTSLSLLSIEMMLTPKVHKGYSQLLVSKLCLVQMLRFVFYILYLCLFISISHANPLQEQLPTQKPIQPKSNGYNTDIITTKEPVREIV